VRRADNLGICMCRLSRNSGSLKLLNPECLFQASIGIALPFIGITVYTTLFSKCVLSNTHLLNLEITQRHGQYKYIHNFGYLFGTVVTLSYMFPPTRSHLKVFQIVQEYKLSLSFVMEAIRAVLLTEYSTLTPSDTTSVYFNYALHVFYMFRHFLRPSSGMSIQKSSKGR
jgi:hypothetical protein